MSTHFNIFTFKLPLSEKGVGEAYNLSSQNKFLSLLPRIFLLIKKKCVLVGGGVQLGPLGSAVINRPTVPAPGDYDDGEIGAMIGRGNQTTRIKPVPVPLCLPQTPHAARTRTRAAAVGNQRLTA
jgi:hypothetical protein